MGRNKLLLSAKYSAHACVCTLHTASGKNVSISLLIRMHKEKKGEN